MIKNQKIYILIVLLFLLSVMLVFVFFNQKKDNLSLQKSGEIKIKKDGGELLVNKNGKVLFTDIEGNSYSDYWDTKKTNAFFSYYEKNYLGNDFDANCSENCVEFSSDVNNQNYLFSDDDELYNIVVEDLIDGEDNENGDENIDDYYNQNDNDSDNDQNNENQDDEEDQQGGGSGIDPECEYWIISYCVRKRTPSPTPLATPVSVTIYESNCFDSGNKQTGRTVISNELCVPEE